MKNLWLVVAAITVFVLFCISCKNSLTVTMDGVRSTADCTGVDRPARRSGRRGRMRFTKYNFRYTDQDGQAQTASIQYRVFWKNPEVGESVPIIYAKNSPDLIYYDSVLHVWMFPAMFGGILIALVAKRLIRRRPKVETDRSV